MPENRTKSQPLLSVIIPLYNVERYAAQSIDSIVGQTLGFEDNIELILVNDGSKDDTEAVCRRYIEEYPENILYIQQKNSGVSAARNNGIDHATGKYITFLDGDDIWGKDSFKESVAFLEENSEVDFVASKIKFFDKTIEEHPYNYKFKSSRVIDLEKEPDSPMLHAVTCVFRRSALNGRRFDTKLKVSEDAKLLSEILLDKKAYGVVKKGQYNYRKRQDETSAIGGQLKNRDFFLVTPKRAYKCMMDLWRDESGRVALFMQYQVLSDLVWRLAMEKQYALSGEEERQYKNEIYALIRDIDTKTILQKRALSFQLKLFLLKVKYGKQLGKRIDFSKDVYRIDGEFLCRAGAGNRVFIDFIHPLSDNTYKIEGYFEQPPVKKSDSFVVTTSKGEFIPKKVARPQRAVSFLGDEIFDGGAFEADIKVGDTDTVEVLARGGEGAGVRLPIVPNQLSGLSALPSSYHRYGDALFTINSSQIHIAPYAGKEVAKKELKHLVRILFSWRLSYAREQFNRLRTRNLTLLSPKAKVFEILKPFLFVAEAVVTIPRALLLRTAYHLAKPFITRPIWLVSDRGMAAGDNGEALFRYIHTRDGVYANVYFVISKKSPDYRRMKEVGKVLDQGSLYYQLLFLLSSKILSSQADVEVTNPFFRQNYHFLDLFYFDFIFLQHGIIKNDLSSWLNRFSKNVGLFVTSAQKEHDSILSYPYHYSKEAVALTGLPRYDRLKNSPTGKLIIAPTYRKTVARKRTNTHGMRPYDELFKTSEYYRQYNRLIHDKRLNAALKQHGMTGEFYLHPVFAPQTADFSDSERIKIMKFPYDYRKAFNEGSVLVTDYSSLVFDFAYLKKPVVYYKFDADDFYSQQIYSEADFFDDDIDGFGPTATTHDDIVEEVTKALAMKNKMPKKYTERVETFFYKTDTNNSKRVYGAIVAQDKKETV